MVKLFAVGFLRETDELQLVELFSEHGLVHTVTIIRDQLSGLSKGYAFIEMLDKPGAERAIKALDGFVIAGRTLHVRPAEDKPQPPENRFYKTGEQRSNVGQRNPDGGKRPRRNRQQ